MTVAEFLVVLGLAVAPQPPLGIDPLPRTPDPEPLVSPSPEPLEVSSSATVSSTAYCLTGTMANGQAVYDGAVAANLWPLGTRLRIVELDRVFTVADRIGHSSELDVAMPGRCSDALAWGRRTVTVEVISD